MSIRLQDITTSTNLDMTDKLLVSDGSSEHLVTVATLLGFMNQQFQGLRTTSMTLTGDTNMYKISLDGDGVETPSGASGMSRSTGGILVSEAGTYKITASMYAGVNTNGLGVYIWYGTTFTDGPAADTGATELCGWYDTTDKSSTHQVTGIVSVAANTIFWLVGRASTSNTSVSNGWLLVERMA